MPLYDLVANKVIPGPRVVLEQFICTCSHTPQWHNGMDRSCGHSKCNCPHFVRVRGRNK